MATAYIYFGKIINSDTSSQFVHGCRSIMGDKDANQKFLWDRFHVTMSTGGGDVIGAFGMYNELKALSIKVSTHNSGAVDSSAIVPFMAGDRRTAASYSSFLFHQIQWTFPAKESVTATVIQDAVKWIAQFESMMADLVAKNTKLQSSDVLKMMREGTIINPTEAKKLGIIHDIDDYKIPQDARSWQV